MKKILKTLLKIVLALILLAVSVFGVFYAIYNEPLPLGRPGTEADLLAEKMLNAINYDTYKQTRYLEWSFADDAHRYKWDKETNEVRVEWDDYRALLLLNSFQKSTLFENNVEVVGNTKVELIKKAISYFNNDSFWLVAPFKVFDKGTERSLVELKDGSNGLLISYTSGGTTPGDSYLWKLSANGFPESYRMWVDIIPIGGLEATWDDWQVMESGVFLPISHKLGPMTLDMGKVRAYN